MANTVRLYCQHYSCYLEKYSLHALHKGNAMIRLLIVGIDVAGTFLFTHNTYKLRAAMQGNRNASKCKAKGGFAENRCTRQSQPRFICVKYYLPTHSQQ
jgi:hypothetical protein